MHVHTAECDRVSRVVGAEIKMERQYIKATEKYNTAEQHVCAPILRREFRCTSECEEAVLEISSTGFYRVYLNGADITRGYLAPYRMKRARHTPSCFVLLKRVTARSEQA